MNNKIISNLFEFWTYIGETTELLIEKQNYKAIYLSNSDWPKRIFAVSDKTGLINEISNLSNIGELPNLITIHQKTKLEESQNLELILVQKNMAINLNTIEHKSNENENIFQVRTKADAIEFAQTASISFGYKVDAEIVFKISQNDLKVSIFNYIKEKEYLGCGILYFDSYNNAGLHMIGTVPKARGLGIGTQITKKLLSEAINNKNNFAVLHASLMGEPIYKKLGFISYGETETYRILNLNNK